MAISQTMSNPNNNDWLFQSTHNQSNFPNITDQIGEAPPTTVAGGAGGAAASAARANNLSPDHGRVAKPVRRRSRASRRTPTTLLNTDAANFRAMVQRFTGGPAAAAQAAHGGGGLNFMEHVAGGGFHVQYLNQLQQQHMFIHGGGGGGGGGGQAAVAPPLPPASAPGNENRSYDNYML